MTALNELGAAAAAAAIARGEITAQALAEACLAHIAEREPVVGAFESFDAEGVLRAARQADATPPRGPLHGVPFAAKDIMDSADHPTGWGSAIYAGHQPGRDASCVRLLREAGGILIGKTVTTEFAYFRPGRTANPRNPAHTPGGSSSGSAAAVADCMVPLALGSQTAGSLIRPAAYCGVIGYKPGHGIFDLSGCMSFAPSLDTLGGLAREVADLALLHDVLVPGADLRAAHQPDDDWRPRVGLMRGPHWNEADIHGRDACQRALEALRNAGAETGEISVPASFEQLSEYQKTVMAWEAARARLHEFRVHRAHISDAFAALIETGLSTPYADYRAALSGLSAARRLFAALVADWDALIVPAAMGEAPEGLGATGDPLHSRAWTGLQVPAMSLPCGHGPAGLPLAAQLVAGPGCEARLLRCAAFAAPLLAAI